MEASCWLNSGIKYQVHEPFDNVGHSGANVDEAYRIIFESIDGEALEQSAESMTICVKEMTFQIGKGKYFTDFMRMVEGPVIVLVRNPLLTIESRIRRVLEGLDDEIAKAAGYPSLDAFVQKKTGDPNASWQAVLEARKEAQDYTIFAELLDARIDNEILFPDWKTGWEMLGDQLAQLQVTGKDYVVMDATEVRMDPETMMQRVCELWNLTYEDKMVHWTPEDLEALQTGQMGQEQAHWYKRLRKCRGFEAPAECPPGLDAFPERFQRHILEVALPAYLRALRDSRRVRIAEG